jgi:hypothetical protein
MCACAHAFCRRLDKSTWKVLWTKNLDKKGRQMPKEVPHTGKSTTAAQRMACNKIKKMRTQGSPLSRSPTSLTSAHSTCSAGTVYGPHRLLVHIPIHLYCNLSLYTSSWSRSWAGLCGSVYQNQYGDPFSSISKPCSDLKQGAFDYMEAGCK